MEQQLKTVHCSLKAFSKASVCVSSVSVMDIQLGDLILIFTLKSLMLPGTPPQILSFYFIDKNLFVHLSTMDKNKT